VIIPPVRMIRRRIARMRRRARRAIEPHGLVLMYHRVADAAVDPWGLCVSAEHFASQLKQLAERADIVPLDSLRGSLRAKGIRRPVVAITFDDGYLDNLLLAKPIMREQAVPATVFLSTGYVDSTARFWWDSVAVATLGGHSLPPHVQFEAAGERFTWSDRALPRMDARGAAARQRLHDRLWTWLSTLSNAAREEALGQLHAWIPEATQAGDGGRAMTAEEVRELVSDGLLTIGGHTVSHCMLSRLATAEKTAEIEQCRDACRRLTGREPTCFAYPHGDLDAESVELVRSAGFSVACTSRVGLVWPDTDPLLTPRVAVGDWTGAELIDRLERECLV